MENIRILIDRYKLIIQEKGIKDELYKWNFISKFKGKPDINAKDFKSEIYNLRFGNLVYQAAPGVLKLLVDFDEEKTRQMFILLFNESIDLKQRIVTFEKESKELLSRIDSKLSHSQEERSIATYLTYYNPSKYTLYKDSYYTEYCKFLSIPKKSKNDKYIHYLSLIQDLSENYIKKDTDLLQIVETEIGSLSSIDPNYLLLAQDILFQLLTADKNDKEISSKKYWFFSPGINGDKWEEFQSEGLAAIPWPELNDLNDYTSKEEIVKRLQGIGNSTASMKNDALANYEFKAVMSVGDIIICKTGSDQLLGYGEITSDYYYNESKEDYKKCRDVNWIRTGSWTFPFSLATKTLTDITSYKDDEKVYDKYYERLLAVMNGKLGLKNYKIEFQNWLDKTHLKNSGMKSSYMRAIEILSEILKQEIFELDNIEKLNELYSDLIKEQKTESGKYYFEKAPSYGENGYYSAAINSYLSFLQEYSQPKFESISKNQNMSNHALNTILYGPPGTGKTYSTIDKVVEICDKEYIPNNHEHNKTIYERLVKEGRVVFTTFHQSMGYEDFIEGIKAETDENSNIKYSVKPGIFKRLVNKAKGAKVVEENFEITYEKLLDKIKSNNGSIILETTEQAKEFTIYENSKGNIKFHANTEKKYEGVIRKDFLRIYLETGESLDWPSYIRGIAKFMIDELGYNKETKEVKQNYVLIIDEINRGNVSQIFGELITLIEEDKRLGEKNDLTVTLPYSNEIFGVPSNLFILGTMNTADRSVESLDTALRRRFSFLEMLPDPSKLIDKNYRPLIVKDINLQDLLFTINKRIEFLVDRDHTIGHAFFIGVDSIAALKSTFKNKIIPLLQEYFYGNYYNIELVLGSGFFNKKEKSKVRFALDNAEVDSDGFIYDFINFDSVTEDEFIQLLNDIKIETFRK